MRLRYKIVLEQINPYDFAEFQRVCAEAQIPSLSILEWGQKVQCLMNAITKYPEREPFDAYMQLIKDQEGHLVPPKPAPISPEHSQIVPCDDCGKSRGLGDTIYKITHATGLDKLAEIYTKITGKDCGCSHRQEVLNKLVPYGIKEENQ